MKERTITVNGFSKTYSMTGDRLGYAGGPSKIIEAMTTIQSHAYSHPSSTVQKGGVVALRGPQNFVSERLREYRKRRDVVIISRGS